jgi:hypothetical protein
MTWVGQWQYLSTASLRTTLIVRPQFRVGLCCCEVSAGECNLLLLIGGFWGILGDRQIVRSSVYPQFSRMKLSSTANELHILLCKIGPSRAGFAHPAVQVFPGWGMRGNVPQNVPHLPL